MQTVAKVRNNVILPLGALLALQAAIGVLIACAVGVRGWDDGAITLAFSHTFSDTGRIALSAASEQVEGFSSPSWFLINAAVARFNPGFSGAIFWSQILTAFFLAVATLFVFLLAESLALKRTLSFAICVALSLFGPFLTEIANGMEMAMLSAASTALVYSIYFNKNIIIYSISTIVFIFTRFEAAIYFAAIILPLIFFHEKKSFLYLFLLGSGVFIAQELVRHSVFMDFLPATIHAKAHFPYSKDGLIGVAAHVLSAFELPLVALPFILFITALSLFIPQIRLSFATTLISRKRDILVLAAPVVAIELFAILTGINLGYPGRMELAAFPFVFLIFGVLVEGLDFARLGNLRPILIFGALAVEVMFSWELSARSTLSDIYKLMNRSPDIEGAGGITPGFYRATGLAADRLRNLMGLKTIVFMTADVGGVGLCCSHVRVVDLGMLTNVRLAKDGYAALPTVMAQERPDVIEIHNPWAKRSHLYILPAFSENYQASFADSTRLYIRDDRAEQLVAGGHAQWCYPKGGLCDGLNLNNNRYAKNDDADDNQNFLRSGKVLIVRR